LPPPRRFSLKANDFFQYWKDTESLATDRLIVYVWRTYPVIDKKILDPDAVTNIGKMEAAPDDPTEWRQAILHQFGSGNYKLMLKDEGKGINKAIAQTFITDLNDPEYPAVIDNYDELVMDHPSNQSFIEKLRQQGKLPGENELAQQESTAALTGTIDRLANKLVDREGQPATPAAIPSTTEVAKEAMGMAREMFREGLDLGQATVQAKADAKVAEAKAAASAGDPTQSIGMLTQLIALAKSLMPATPTAVEGQSEAMTTLIGKLVDRESTTQGQLVTFLQNQINALSARPAATNPEVAVAAQTAKPDDFVTQLKKLGELKDTMQDIFGGGGGGDDDAPREKPEPMWMKLGMAALAGLPSLAMSLVGMSYNMAVAKTGQGAPMAPNALPPPVPMPGLDGTPAAPVAGNPDPNPNPAPGGDMNIIQRNVYMAMLQQIEKPLLAHLNNPEKSGVDFAEAMMAFHGDIAYQATRGLGKEVLMGLLMSYKPIAEVLATIPEKANQFVDDFLNAEEIIAAEEAEDAGEGKASAAAAPDSPAAAPGRRGKGK
jgi:hypothetical protein